MAKGDRKTRRGKIWRGSYGKTRPHREDKKK
jgi:30S ribosomal protein S31